MHAKKVIVTALAMIMLMLVPLTASANDTADILYSTSPDRSGPVLLDGNTVDGPIYVFVPDIAVKQVSFFIDDPTMAGAPARVEGIPPFDLAGSAANGDALPLNAGTLSPGPHTITVLITYDDNTQETKHATFSARASLQFAGEEIVVQVGPGRAIRTRGMQVVANDGTEVAYAVNDDADWITLETRDGLTPDRVIITIDPTNLEEGRHTATVTATADGLFSDTLQVTLDVIGVLLSDSPDRSNPVPLRGATVASDIYVFLPPDVDIGTVQFWLDDAKREGAPIHAETLKPIDFVGTAPDGSALPFDTTALPEGRHNIVAGIELLNGNVRYVRSGFIVDNLPPELRFGREVLKFSVDVNEVQTKTVNLRTEGGLVTPYDVTDDADWLTLNKPTGMTPEALELTVNTAGLAPGLYNATVTATADGFLPTSITISLHVGYKLFVSLAPDRSGAVDLHRNTVAGNIYAFVDDPAIVEATFYLDDVRREGVPFRLEETDPFDFNGTHSSGNANAYDTTLLINEHHVIVAELLLTDGTIEIVRARFLVNNPLQG